MAWKCYRLPAGVVTEVKPSEKVTKNWWRWREFKPVPTSQHLSKWSLICAQVKKAAQVANTQWPIDASNWTLCDRALRHNTAGRPCTLKPKPR